MIRRISLIKITTVLTNFFVAVGFNWMFVEIVNFFFKETGIENLFWVFFILSISYSIIKSIPKLTYTYKLNNRDTHLKLVVGDILKSKAKIIIPINSHFDCILAGNVMRSNSLKKQLIEKHFDNNPISLQSIVDSVIEEKGKYLKLQKVNDKYKFGTTVEIDKDNQRYYLVANSIKKENNRVETNLHTLKETLVEMWRYMSEEADRIDTLALPLFGTGQGRIPHTREEVFRLIVDTALDISEGKVFADCIEIYISPKDIKTYSIDIEELANFLEYSVRYRSYTK